MFKKKEVRCFYDFEFTGLHKDTTPISLGITSEDGYSFYAEYTDYNESQVDDWIRDNVIDHLILLNDEDFPTEQLTIGNATFVKGTTDEVTEALRQWVNRFDYIEFWGDCSWYDGVLLNEALGGAFNLPDPVNYLFFDIATILKIHGLDPDVDREAFIDKPIEGEKHNSLYDAKVIEACYEKLRRNWLDYGNML
jgi:hypothetical protein